jgi:hypothetical protein
LDFSTVTAVLSAYVLKYRLPSPLATRSKRLEARRHDHRKQEQQNKQQAPATYQSPAKIVTGLGKVIQPTHFVSLLVSTPPTADAPRISASVNFSASKHAGSRSQKPASSLDSGLSQNLHHFSQPH